MTVIETVHRNQT